MDHHAQSHTVGQPIDETAGRSTWWVVAIAITVGSAIRVAEVAQGHSFGFDDGMLAINIVTRSAAHLARPLAFDQTAPILFLWLDRLLIDLLGINGVVLRLMPLVAGIAVLPLTWVVGRRLVGAVAAALTVALLAVSPLAVDYTNTTKPYIVDAAVALVLVALTLRVLRDPARPAGWLALAVAGPLGIVLSTPAVFTLAACIGALLTAPSIRQRGATRILALAVVWAAVAAANYLAFQRSAAHNSDLQRFWAGAFFTPGEPHLAARVRVVASRYIQNLFFGMSIHPWILLRVATALLVAIGVVRVWRRTGAWAAVLLTGPLAIAIVAAVVRAYPPSDRTWLFAAPSVALLAASGLVALCDRLPGRLQRPVLVAAGIGALVLPGRQSWLALRAALQPDGLQAALRAWRADARPGEPIYIFSRDAIRWAYYTTNWTRPDTARLDWLLAAAQGIGPNSGNAPSRGHAVRDEGDGLVYLGTGRAELIGIPTGMEDGGITPATTAPDTGWAENEARRLAAVARAPNAGVWMFFVYCPMQIDTDLVVASERRGAKLTSARRFGSVRLYRVEFAPTGVPSLHVYAPS